jgi:hypothetical protein
MAVSRWAGRRKPSAPDAPPTAAEEAAGMLVWLVERGLPEAVDAVLADARAAGVLGAITISTTTADALRTVADGGSPATD